MRVTLLLSLLVAGCADNGQGTLSLSWQFADGRRCEDSGAFSIVVHASDDLGTFRCTDGTPPAAADVPNVPRDGHVTIHAYSPQMTELYRAELDTDTALEPTTVTLYATAVR